MVFAQRCLSLLEQLSEETGTKVGYKIFQDGEVVAQQYCEKNGPFISFFQKANHLYLYGVRAPVNAFHAKKRKTVLGVQHHNGNHLSPTDTLARSHTHTPLAGAFPAFGRL